MERVRSLGFAEARMHAQQTYLSGSTQSTVAVLLSGHVSLVAVRAAAVKAQARYALLNVAIAEHDEAWWFARTGPARTPSVSQLARGDDATWMRNFAAINSRPLSREGAMWGLILVSDPSRETTDRCELIFQFQHAILDGVAALTLLEFVLEVLGEHSAASGPEEPCPTFPPPAEAFLRTASWADFQHTQRKLAAPPDKAIYPTLVERWSPAEPHRTRTWFMTVAEGRLQQLQQVCEEEGLSLTSVIASAILRAASRCSVHQGTHSLFMPMSLRPLCPGLRDDQLGCYLSIVPTHHGAKAASLIEVARAHRAQLGRAVVLAVRHPQDPPTPTQLRDSFRECTPRDQVLGLSMLDRRLRTRYADLAVRALHGAANRASGQAAYAVHGFLAANSLHLSASYTEGVQCERWAASMTDALAHELKASLLAPQADNPVKCASASEEE